MSRKVVAYIRVSTEEQASHGYSIDVQKEFLQDYAKGHKLKVVRQFVESESAYKPGRPEYAKMLSYLAEHRTVTAVLCYKVDRLSRNITDYAHLVEELGVDVLSATEQFPSNASGRLMGDMQAAYSRYYSAQLSERVKPAMEKKARQGIYPSFAPVGYLNDRETKTLTVDPERAPMIRELFERYAQGEISLRALVIWAKKRGLRTRQGGVLARAALHKLLTNPIYCGVVRWGSVTAPGIHEPIVPRHVFDRVQDVLHGRGRSQTKHRFAFRGLLRCGHCGCQITATLAKGRYTYYHCTQGKGKCSQPYVREDRLAQRLAPVVDGVQVPEDVAAQLIEAIRKNEKRRTATLDSRLKTLRQEIQRLTSLRDKAYVDKATGVLTEQRWASLDSQWASRLDELEKQIQSIQEAQRSTGTDDAREAFELLKRAGELYSQQTPQEQAEALRMLVSNCELRGAKIVPHYRKPFDLVAVGNETGYWYPQEDSNRVPSDGGSGS